MRFEGYECNLCKKIERWDNPETLPPKWSALRWYEQATEAGTIVEEAMFCSDTCLKEVVAKI